MTEMIPYPPTVVYRHRKENLKKCSLRGLESREDFNFYTYPNEDLPDLPGYILLDMDAPPLSQEDAHRGLLILDGTWRYAEKMSKRLVNQSGLVKRRIPSFYQTAYPRKQDDCPDPSRGLASIEAIYIAYQMMGRPSDGLLDHYYWATAFVEANKIS